MSHGKCRTHKAHRLTCAELDELYARADTACEVCLIPECDTPGGKLNIDHDRRLGAGAVRGLVCPACNSLLGRIDSGKQPASPAVARYLAHSWHISARPRRLGGGADESVKVRVDDTTWDSFVAACRAMGTTPSSALRDYMRRYVAAWKGRQAKGDHGGSSD